MLPAFLDALDEITLWLAEPQLLAAVQKRFQVLVKGRSVPVVSVRGGEPAPLPPDPHRVVLAGTFQAALGGKEWNPAGEETRLQAVSATRFERVLALPAGSHAYKVARGGSWAENYGTGFTPNGPNLVLELKEPQLVRFVVDFAARTIQNSVTDPEAVAPPHSLSAPPPTPAAPTRYQSFRVRLGRKLTEREVSARIQARFDDEPWRTVYGREALSDPIFFYAPSDLGAHWTKHETTFKLWSPVAESVTLVLGTQRLPLLRGRAGLWFRTVAGDWHGTPYHYELHSYGQARRAADIYGVAATPDSARSLVVDLRRTNPPGWPAARPFTGKKPTDAVLYELHLRDFTIHPSSEVRPAWRGKYIGLAQKSDYLARLGVTHIHLLPLQDFNPAHSKGYNWGYETTLFNVPEEQYATAGPPDPLRPIRELKQLVQTLHQRGLAVVMDVVYNHTVPSHGPLSAFWESVPYYYFRTNDRGELLNESGVGNALHDEHPMVRKFVRESLAFWSREYKIDGFRFDLLGMFTRETVAALAQEIRRQNPSALIYGEPWTGGGPLRFGKGDQRGLGVAVFNDHFRNTVRGDLDGAEPGFALGGPARRQALELALAGSIDDFAASPSESVNYVSAHDNRTFWDKVALSLPEEPTLQRAAVKLAHATVLLAQGIPFLEGGVEQGRTKGGNPNSYNAGDAANQFDWQRGRGFTDVGRYLAGLIALRRAHPALRLATRAQVKSTLTFLPFETGAAFVLQGSLVGDRWKKILVVLHGGKKPGTFLLPEGVWQCAVDAQRAGTKSLGTRSGAVTLPPLSALVVYQL